MPDFGVPLWPIVRVVFKVALLLAVVALLTPWMALVFAWYAGRQVALIFRLMRRLKYVFATQVPCLQGHRSSVFGMFECRSCGALFAGHAFQNCPVCGMSCGYTTCEHCGLAVRNPWV